jgi:hypothetical protein
MTDDLIGRLSRDLRPVRARAVTRRLSAALAVGAVVALGWVIFGLGLRPDMNQAVEARMFWIKLAYPLALAGLAIWCVERLARPGGEAGRRLPWLAAPLILMAVIATIQLAGTPAPDRAQQLMGHSAMVCPGLILLTALPIFAALIWAVRGLAPTRSGLAGAMAGLTAGGLGAAIYTLHCNESAAPFLAIWYTLGIVAPAMVGALAGPRLLRW